MILTEKFLIHPKELPGKPIVRHLVAKQEELAKGMMNLALNYLYSYFK
jgi:hypothetical protein